MIVAYSIFDPPGTQSGQRYLIQKMGLCSDTTYSIAYESPKSEGTIQSAKLETLTLMRICIYTSIYGGYDDLKVQPKQSIPADFVCFTDSEIASPSPWTVIRDQRLPDLHPRLRAKWHKTHSHCLSRSLGLYQSWRWRLKRYTHTIWIDGSVQITSPDFARVWAQAAQPTGWAMLAHPRRNCIYDEMEFSKSMLKYQGQRMAEQVTSYRVEGFPEQWGLMACAIIARQTNRPVLDTMNEEWWHENLLWTYQDQLSLPVIFWRRGLKWDVVPGNVWTNDFFQVHRHTADT